MHRADKTIVAVFQWPAGATITGKANAIANITGMDVHQARLMVKRDSVPQTFSIADHAAAIKGTRKLTRSGVDVIAVPATELAAHACRHLAKRFIAGHDESGQTWLAEQWGDSPRVIRAADLVVLVRARIRLDAGTDFTVNSAAMNVGVSPIGGGIRVNPPNSAEPLVTTSKKTRMAEILDIHLADQPPIRVHGDKFSFDVLGQGKGITDSENMDLLATHFAKAAPQVAVDVSFKGFKPSPDGVRAFHLAAGKRGDPRVQVPVEFEFYSAWMAVRNLRQLGS